MPGDWIFGLDFSPQKHCFGGNERNVILIKLLLRKEENNFRKLMKQTGRN